MTRVFRLEVYLFNLNSPAPGWRSYLDDITHATPKNGCSDWGEHGNSVHGDIGAFRVDDRVGVDLSRFQIA